MTRWIISSIVSVFIFGGVGMSGAEWEHEAVREQPETYEQNEQAAEQQTCDNPNCRRCHPKCRKRWRSTRFAERQFQETGWPGRRGDELSDELSR